MLGFCPQLSRHLRVLEGHHLRVDLSMLFTPNSLPHLRCWFILRVLVDHLAQALMLILEFLTKFVKRCLYLGERGIGIFHRLLIVFLLVREQQISAF